MVFKKSFFLILLFGVVFSISAKTVADSTHRRKWQLGVNYHLLGLKYSDHFLAKHQAVYYYKNNCAINAGLVIDFTREISRFDQRGYGIRNSYFVGHQWVLLNKKKSLLGIFNSQLWYTNGDIKSGGQDTPDNFTATALFGVLELIFEKRFSKYLYVQAVPSIGLSYMYSSNDNNFQPIRGLNFTWGIMF